MRKRLAAFKRWVVVILFFAGLLCLLVPVANFYWPAEDLFDDLARLGFVLLASFLGGLFWLAAIAIFIKRYWRAYVENRWAKKKKVQLSEGEFWEVSF